MNKAKGRQSSRHAGKYKERFAITARNKARRAARRAKWLAKRKAKAQ